MSTVDSIFMYIVANHCCCVCRDLSIELMLCLVDGAALQDPSSK